MISNIVIAAIALFLLYQCSQIVNAPENKLPSTARDEAPRNDPAKCNVILDKAAKDGLIRERPSGNRINVEGLKWAALPASEKSVIAQMLFCANYGGRTIEQAETMDFVVVYGFRSGKKLAMLSDAGLNFE